MIFFIGIMIVIGLGKWLIYTGLLWGMIKIQKFDYNVLGLFASSLVATALGYIPFVGHYIGWVVLVLCLWKCTGAPIAPDVFFTVGIAGALMFCVNLFVIGALMGDLTLPVAALHARANAGQNAFDDSEEIEQPDGATNFLKLAGNPWRQTNAAVTRSNPAPQMASLVARSVAPVAVAPTVEGRALAAKLSLKGVGMNGSGKSAMIADGRQIFTVGLGDLVSVPSAQGTVTMVCEDITQTSVTLALERGEKIKVGFR